MDAGQAAALTGPQLRELGEAISDAFAPAALIQTLFYRLDKPEWALPDGDSYPHRIRLLLINSRQEGWLHELIDAVVLDRPRDLKLKTWIEVHAHRVTARPSASQLLFDTSNFDLDPLRKAVRNAAWASASRVLGLGFTYPDGVFLDKFAGWLVSQFGRTQIKQKMNLLPEIGSVTKHVRDLARYRPELKTANVLCEIHAVGVPADTLTAFWHGICDEFGSTDFYLVLLISGGNDAIFPAGITALPPPVFDIADVHEWTQRMVNLAGWQVRPPDELARAWAQLLHEQSHYDGRLEVRYLYEAMDRSVTEARLNADEFLRQLEERCHANKTPA